MFVCDKCHPSVGRGFHYTKSVGPCEDCGRVTECSDCRCEEPMPARPPGCMCDFLDGEHRLSCARQLGGGVPLPATLNADRVLTVTGPLAAPPKSSGLKAKVAKLADYDLLKTHITVDGQHACRRRRVYLTPKSGVFAAVQASDCERCIGAVLAGLDYVVRHAFEVARARVESVERATILLKVAQAEARDAIACRNEAEAIQKYLEGLVKEKA